MMDNTYKNVDTFPETAAVLERMTFKAKTSS